jgi:ABC-type branched-subunit amino acid transport system permease subunit
MVIFALVLIGVMIFARQGIMGRREISWEAIIHGLRRVKK